jgi:hypothetical protein
MPHGTPSSSTKISGHLWRHYIFIASYNMCCSWSVLIFAFSFSFVLFAVINGWITSCLLWRETRSIFHCQEHSSFHSYRSASVLFF